MAQQIMNDMVVQPCHLKDIRLNLTEIRIVISFYKVAVVV